MSQPNTPDPQPRGRASRAGQSETDFNLLQSLLVEPEVDKLRRQVSELQQQVAALTVKVQRLEAQQQATATDLPRLIDQKLSALRQELFDALPDIIDDAIEQQIDPGQTFSIRVSGVEQE